MNSLSEIGVSGCRLSDGRLHLGHYLGCFHPQKTELVSRIYFVIQDQDTNLLAGCAPKVQQIKLLCAQLYSIKSSAEIIPCLQTSIFADYAFLFDFARAAVTLRTLESVHPKKDDLRSATGLQLRDYLFPIDQAVQLLAFGASYMLMNDDNLRFSTLAHRLHVKLDDRVRHIIPRPSLLLQPSPRLLASNATKMAKANRNCIYLDDDETRVAERIRDYARNFGWRQTAEQHWLFEGQHDLSDPVPRNSALASIWAAFGEREAIGTLRITDAPEAVDHLISKIAPMIKQIRDNVNVLLCDDRKLLERLRNDTERARDQIKRTWAALEK